jgi:hypothetical protein
MSNFDIEQCKKDGGMAIHNAYGEVTIIIFEKDPDLLRVAQATLDQRYYLVSDEYLTNISKKKKKKITIYVYEDDKGELYATQYLNYLVYGFKLKDKKELEYEI